MEIKIPDENLASVLLATEEVRLSGNRVAVVRAAIGDDTIEAIKALPPTATTVEQSYAMVARCVAIDGKQLTYDLFRKLPYGVIKKVMAASNRLNEDPTDPAPPAPGGSSPGLSSEASSGQA
jgi:hypothetical protein